MSQYINEPNENEKQQDKYPCFCQGAKRWQIIPGHRGINDGKDNQPMGYKEIGYSHINIWGK
jgi:hypothetical protein